MTIVGQQKKRARRSDAIARGEQSARRGLPAIGLEAEFATVVDGVLLKPEEVFGSPRRIVRGPLVHRTGRSYHLPTGGAVYFDTGVIEIATPMIEIERGCGARGVRSLWESLSFLRTELDAWEERHDRSVRLVGFSAHYNVSFDLPESARADGRTVEKLAYLLTHVLAAPVMLLAANRRSTGVGVRPRGNRVEITADFTPDAGLMAATATLIVGIVREVMTWPSFDLDELERHSVPVVREFAPIPHSSRKGWVAKDVCFPHNPFTANVNRAKWTTRTGERLSLREMAGRTTRTFWGSIRELGDPLSLRLIGAVMRGRARSLLELPDRPAAYDDVGRLCTWNDLFPITLLSRSRYERVLGHAISGRRVRMEGTWHRPIGVRGWAHIVFRRERDGVQTIRSLDELLTHLDAWDRTADRRRMQRRVAARAAHELERRAMEDRRAEVKELAEHRRAGESKSEPDAANADAPAIEVTQPESAPTMESAPTRESAPEPSGRRSRPASPSRRRVRRRPPGEEGLQP